MATKIIRPESREEWLKYRESGIGSSEVATIVGLNPWESPYQLWRRKLGLDPAKQENFAMKAGHYLEDAVAQFWHDETGCEIIKRSAIDWLIINTEKPYMRVSPDRTYWLTGLPHNAQNKGCISSVSYIKPQPIISNKLYTNILLIFFIIKNGRVGFVSIAKILKKLQLNRFADDFFCDFA